MQVEVFTEDSDIFLVVIFGTTCYSLAGESLGVETSEAQGS